MITDLKPYATYRNAGVEWLGQVPSGWGVRRQSSLIELRISNVDKHQVQGERPIRLCNYVDVYRCDRIRADVPFSSGTALDREIERFRLRRGDVLITKDSESWEDIASPALVEYEADDLVCGYHLAILRPGPKLSGGYLFWATKSTPVASQYQVSANGVTRFGLTQGDIKQVEIPVPPREDQAAIARFLNHADSRIQRLLRAKEALIGLVEEERRAVIFQAVTGELDRDVPRKPSGLDWLGEVPESWDIIPLRLRYSVRLGKMLDAKRITSASLLPYLRNTDVQWDRINTEDLPEMDISSDERLRYTVKPGDLLVCEGGEVGRAAIWDQPGVVGFQKALHRLRPYDGERDRPRFLYYVLRALADLGALKADGSESTIAHLTAEKLRRLRLPFPPAPEQEAIVTKLDRQLERQERVSVAARSHITLLCEFRTRLISDVVTGKVDVREAAASLPDDPDADGPAPEERLEGVAAG